jgi:hypothetical protein
MTCCGIACVAPSNWSIVAPALNSFAKRSRSASMNSIVAAEPRRRDVCLTDAGDRFTPAGVFGVMQTCAPAAGGMVDTGRTRNLPVHGPSLPCASSCASSRAAVCAPISPAVPAPCPPPSAPAPLPVPARLAHNLHTRRFGRGPKYLISNAPSATRTRGLLIRSQRTRKHVQGFSARYGHLAQGRAQKNQAKTAKTCTLLHTARILSSRAGA